MSCVAYLFGSGVQGFLPAWCARLGLGAHSWRPLSYSRVVRPPGPQGVRGRLECTLVVP